MGFYSNFYTELTYPSLRTVKTVISFLAHGNIRTYFKKTIFSQNWGRKTDFFQHEDGYSEVK